LELASLNEYGICFKYKLSVQAALINQACLAIEDKLFTKFLRESYPKLLPQLQFDLALGLWILKPAS